MTSETEDFKYRGAILPGNVYADMLHEEGYDRRYSEDLALKERAREDNDARQKEGLGRKNKDDSDSDQLEMESGALQFTRHMISDAIEQARKFFEHDINLIGQSVATINNAAAVSVGIGVMIAPNLIPPTNDPVEALRRGRERGQSAVDGLLCDKNCDLLHDLQKNRITRREEEELLLYADKDGKFSDADKKKLDAFMVRNHIAIAVAEPQSGNHPNAPHAVAFFSRLKDAENYAGHLLLKLMGKDDTPSPKSGAKSRLQDEQTTAPTIDPPAA